MRHHHPVLSSSQLRMCGGRKRTNIAKQSQGEGICDDEEA